MNNCVCCHGSFASYKVGPNEDVASAASDGSVHEMGVVKPGKGLCQFCNPASKLYNHGSEHHKPSCRIKT